MLNGIKTFAKKHLLNSSNPSAGIMFYRLKSLYSSMVQKRHRNMTYHEIEAHINRQYEEVFGRPMNWENPKTYNEKIHVSKLYMPTPLKTRLADKYLIREWIREKVGEEYLFPLLGVYDSFDEIDFDALPDQFVIKCSHDSGSVTLVKDKSKMNKKLMKLKYDIAMKMDFAYMGFEMQYRDIKPKIIVEQYMGDAINDYKFLCFDGKPYYCWVDVDRFTNHKRNFYSMDWTLQPFSYNYPNYEGTLDYTGQLAHMKEIAAELCSGFNHSRVDLYLVQGNIYFGEMTFSSENGLARFTPDEWDYKFGELWPFDNTVRKKILASRTKP